MSEELKPCPFCGAKAERYTVMFTGDAFRVRCSGACGDLVNTGSAMTRERADQVWNTRTPDPRIERLVEALWESASAIEALAGNPRMPEGFQPILEALRDRARAALSEMEAGQ